MADGHNVNDPTVNDPNVGEVVELVVYKIKAEMSQVYINSAIEEFRKLVMGFEGIISYEFFQSSRGDNVFMDYVRWSSLGCAENAARQVKILQQSPEYKEYLDSFESLEIFNHFTKLDEWT